MQISRRSVLKSIAAAAMAPLVQLRHTVPDERLLLAFCGERFSLYKIDAPFGVGSLTYATDAYAMVRAEISNRVETGEARLPPVEEAWQKHWLPTAGWRPLTPDDLTPTFYATGKYGTPFKKCPYCGNRRKSLGETYPPMETHEDLQALGLLDYDVDTNTVRDTSCEFCRGTDYPGKDEVLLCGSLFKAYDLRRILALPNVRVCASKSDGTMLFRADGFEGIARGLQV